MPKSDTSEFVAAIDALREGKAILLPTDTVYGLGVAVGYADSPQVIYDLKQRDQGKPVAWLVESPEALDIYGVNVPEYARKLVKRYWPGGLTVIVEASEVVPPAFRSANGTVGLRMPANDAALRLIRVVGPIATSSANASGQSAPCTVGELDPALRESVAAVVEEDEPGSGLASTVIDCSGGEITVIRQGGIMPDFTEDAGVITVPYKFLSHDKRTNINGKLWTTEAFGGPDRLGAEKPKAVIQLIHGMAEYIDRYDEFARYLVGRGFVVCAEDHVGHGNSAASPDDYGHMPLNGGKKVAVGDVHTLHCMVAECFPGVPYVLYGHSMGSFIARAYLARYGDSLAACVLSGTGNPPEGLSKMGRGLARFIASIKGGTYRSKFIDGMGAGSYGKRIENARTSLDWLSTDESVVDAYIADDKCGFMFTVGGYATLLDLTSEVVTPECAGKVPKDLPVLFVSGDGDPVGDMGQGVKAAAQLLSGAGVKTVDCTLYPGMRHEIHNEIGKAQVYDDIASWIEAHVS